VSLREWIATHILGREPEPPAPTEAELERRAELQRAVDLAVERQLQGLPPEQLAGLDAWAEEFRALLHAVTAEFEERYGMTVDEYLDRHGAYPPEVGEELTALSRELEARYPDLPPFDDAEAHDAEERQAATEAAHGDATTVAQVPETERGWQWWDPDARDGDRASGQTSADTEGEGGRQGGGEGQRGHGWDPSDVDWTYDWGSDPGADVPPIFGHLGPVWTQGGLHEPELTPEQERELRETFDAHHDPYGADLAHHEDDFQRVRSASWDADIAWREPDGRIQSVPMRMMGDLEAWYRREQELNLQASERLWEALRQEYQERTGTTRVEGDPGTAGNAARPEAAVQAVPADEPERAETQPGAHSWADRWAERQAQLPAQPDVQAELVSDDMTPASDAERSEADLDDPEPR
jgi:hypothetical protein